MTISADVKIVNIFISTHTLTWSVTSTRLYLTGTRIRNFNSHAHVERDRLGMHSTVLIGNFNSHAHVERDYNVDSRK